MLVFLDSNSASGNLLCRVNVGPIQGNKVSFMRSVCVLAQPLHGQPVRQGGIMVRNFRLNIFHKLLLTLLAVSLVPLVTLWGVGSAAAKRDAGNAISQALVMTVNTIATSITDWDEGNVRTLQQAALLEDMVSMRPERQGPVLKAIGETYPWSFVVFTIAPDGNNISRNDGKPLIKYGERSYFQAAMAGEAAARQVLISKSTGKPALTLATPIRGAAGDKVGVLAMAMKLDDIARVIKDSRIGETGYVVLLDADNKVIASGMAEHRRDTVQDFSAYPALKLEGVTEKPVVYMNEGRQLVSYVRKLPQGWTLLVEQEVEEAYAPLIKLERQARILILVTVLFVMSVAYVLGKQLTRPINGLIAVAQLLSNGQFKVTIPETGRGDEIGALARAIERLGISIALAMDRLRKKA
jgi:methyl-accepting chemotaxis protein